MATTLLARMRQRAYPSARSLGNQRRFLVVRILKRMEPHLRDSGYRKALNPTKGLLGKSRPLRFWSPPDRKNGEPQNLGGFLIGPIYAITEDGVMTEAWGGGAVTSQWRDIPLEDLVKLQNNIEKWLAIEAPKMAKAA